MRSELQGKVVVITGASSGIGRATAHRFAEHGARLVVAARRVRPLDQAVRECVLLGGEATAVQVDVSNPASMESMARRAVESYGRVDIWVNNAAVSLYARVDDGPLEVHRRVIETNLLGYLCGARLAVRIFRKQGRGVLVNVSSAAAYVGQPYMSASRVLRYAAEFKDLDEPLRDFIKRKGGSNKCAARFARRQLRRKREMSNCAVQLISPR